jgi:hypothetical protein
LNGGIGCILSYGQTGSGKTYTMEGLEHLIARDLFDVATAVAKRFAATEANKEQQDAGVMAGDVFEFEVTFLELLGKSAADLVDEPTGTDAHGNALRKEIAIQEDKVGLTLHPLFASADRFHDPGWECRPQADLDSCAFVCRARGADHAFALAPAHICHPPQRAEQPQPRAAHYQSEEQAASMG